MHAQRIVVTANNRGPLVNIVAWVTLIAICLSTSIKVGIKYARLRGVEMDDAYMLGAMVRLVLCSLQSLSLQPYVEDYANFTRGTR